MPYVCVPGAVRVVVGSGPGAVGMRVQLCVLVGAGARVAEWVCVRAFGLRVAGPPVGARVWVSGKPTVVWV